MAMLEVKDLEVYYGMIQAIKGISFEVNQGEVIALIGANGAGKTTTLQTITGMLQAKKGHILFEGQDITKVPGHKIVTMGMAHVPEGRRVFAEQSVRENLLLGAYFRKDKQEIEKDLAYVYDLFPRLKEREKQLAGTLSGGEQQRVGIARAIVNGPPLLIADEPTTALDVNTQESILKLMKKLNQKYKMSILFISHNLRVVNEICSRVIVMKNGEIVEEGETEEIFKNPQHEYTKQLIEAIPTRVQKRKIVLK